MAYRADFYRPENIIGYTGAIDLRPTVYFLTGPPSGPNEYGHITQFHTLRSNLGRERVRKSSRYEMRQNAGTGNLEEWDGGQRFHTSRSKFISSNGLSADKLALLAEAIGRFPDQKTWGNLSGAERKALIKDLAEHEEWLEQWLL